MPLPRLPFRLEHNVHEVAQFRSALRDIVVNVRVASDDSHPHVRTRGLEKRVKTSCSTRGFPAGGADDNALSRRVFPKAVACSRTRRPRITSRRRLPCWTTSCGPPAGATLPCYAGSGTTKAPISGHPRPPAHSLTIILRVLVASVKCVGAWTCTVRVEDEEPHLAMNNRHRRSIRLPRGTGFCREDYATVTR